jgi:hypothetical protein
MQYEEARELERKWGDKPCDHPHLEKEYYLGASTGDYVCTRCGTSGWGRDWNKREKENKKNNY